MERKEAQEKRKKKEVEEHSRLDKMMADYHGNTGEGLSLELQIWCVMLLDKFCCIL